MVQPITKALRVFDAVSVKSFGDAGQKAMEYDSCRLFSLLGLMLPP